MAETLFSSDPHFNHLNIIKFCNRPYASVEEMNQGLEEEHNKVVGPKDHFWCLGDVMWGDFDINRLNGIKHLIIGNHDSLHKLGKFFKEVLPYHELKGILPKNRAIPLFHYPIESWNGKFHGAIHLHGHTHNTLDNSGLLRFDVGVDAWNMKPISIEDILKLVPLRKEQMEKSRDEGFKQLNERADRES